MTCWDILGLTPNADKKAIKLAYARLLKKTRPEDDPEGFKRLYEAYQQALDWQANGYYIDYADEQTASEPEDNQPPAIVEPNESVQIVVLNQTPLPNEILPETKPSLAELHLTPPLSQTEAELQLEPPTTEYYLNQPVAPALIEPTLFNDDLKFDEDWQFFLKGCSTALHTDAARTDLNYWHFLKNIPSLTNLEFKERASLKLFSHIADANLIALEQKTLYIKPPVLNFLNELFDWDSQANYLNQHFSLAKVDAVLTYIDKQLATMDFESGRESVYPQAKQALLFWHRLGAIILDLLIILCIFVAGAMIVLIARSYGVDKALEAEMIGGFTSLLMLYVLALMPILEVIYQASPGKRLLGLKVVNQYGKKMKWYHAFGRHFAFIIALIFRGLWLANIFTVWRHRVFIHDYISRSYVVLKNH